MIENLYEIIEIATKKDYATMNETHGYVDIAANGKPIAAIVPDQPIRYVTLLEFQENIPRGNHCHPKKHEFMVPIQGTLQVKLWLPDGTGKSLELTLRPGKILHILPNCAHTFTAIGGDATAIEFSPQAYAVDDAIELETQK